MEEGVIAVEGFVEAGYWVSPYVFWGVIIILLALVVSGIVFLLYHRRVISAQHSLVQKYREGSDTFRYLVDTAHEGIAVVQNTRLVYLNPRMCEMSGYTKEELKELPSFLPLIHPSAREEMMANYQRRVAGESAPKRYESLFLRKNGSSYPIELSGVPIVWRGKPATLNMLTDISARKAAEQKILYLAHHDSLTGLVNRAVLSDRIEQTIALAKRSTDPFAVLFIDLIAFKAINDTYGHDVGDQLLQQVSERIQQQLRETDTLARVGGDEFVVLLAQIKNHQEVAQVMERIKQCLVEAFQVKDHKLHCYASQGAALYPKDGESVQELLSQADKNMYEEKCNYYGSLSSQ